MRQHILKTRVMSCLTLVFFLISNFTSDPALALESPAPPAALSLEFPSDPALVKVPPEMGKIEDYFKGAAGGMVVLVQDAHEIPDAQRNIQRLIDYFQKNYGVGLIGLEGAHARLDPLIFKSFPDKERLKKVFKEYQEQGELAAGTGSAIFGRGGDYEGVEDWELYEEGIGFYLQAMGEEPRVLEKLKVLENRLKAEKERLYSAELLEVDRVVEHFYRNQGTLPETLRKLAGVKAPPEGSELALILKEGETQGEENLEREVRKAAQKVEAFLRERTTIAGGKKKLAEFSAQYQDFKTSRVTPKAFALFMKTLTAGERLPFRISKALSGSMQEQKRMEQIQGTKFFEDFERYAEEVKESLVQNEDQRELGRKSRELRTLESLAKLELTRDDWNEIKEWTSVGAPLVGARIKGQAQGLPLQLFSNHLAFYRNAEKRDAAMFRNLMRLMETHVISSEARDPVDFSPPGEAAPLRGAGGRNDTAILVAGGFHAEGFTRRLKDKGISYLRLMPNIESIPEETRYRPHMRGEVSWKKYLKSEGNKINLYDAFVRGTRDKLLSSPNAVVGDPQTDPRLLKSWRDQIILDLAKQNKIEKAGDYTRFIDELRDGGEKEKLRAEWMANIDRFLERLGGLKSRNELNRENILNLLKFSGAPTPYTSVGGQSVPGTAFNAIWNQIEVLRFDPAMLSIQVEKKDKSISTAQLAKNSKSVLAPAAPELYQQARSEVKTEESRPALPGLRAEKVIQTLVAAAWAGLTFVITLTLMQEGVDALLPFISEIFNGMRTLFENKKPEEGQDQASSGRSEVRGGAFSDKGILPGFNASQSKDIRESVEWMVRAASLKNPFRESSNLSDNEKERSEKIAGKISPMHFTALWKKGFSDLLVLFKSRQEDRSPWMKSLAAAVLAVGIPFWTFALIPVFALLRAFSGATMHPGSEKSPSRILINPAAAKAPVILRHAVVHETAHEMNYIDDADMWAYLQFLQSQKIPFNRESIAQALPFPAILVGYRLAEKHSLPEAMEKVKNITDMVYKQTQNAKSNWVLSHLPGSARGNVERFSSLKPLLLPLLTSMTEEEDYDSPLVRLGVILAYVESLKELESESDRYAYVQYLMTLISDNFSVILADAVRSGEIKKTSYYMKELYKITPENRYVKAIDLAQRVYDFSRKQRLGQMRSEARTVDFNNAQKDLGETAGRLFQRISSLLTEKTAPQMSRTLYEEIKGLLDPGTQDLLGQVWLQVRDGKVPLSADDPLSLLIGLSYAIVGQDFVRGLPAPSADQRQQNLLKYLNALLEQYAVIDPDRNRGTLTPLWLIFIGLSPVVKDIPAIQAYVELSKKLKELPESYRYRTVALSLILAGSHLDEITSQTDAPDIEIAAGDVKFALEGLKKEIPAADEKALKIGLVRFLQGAKFLWDVSRYTSSLDSAELEWVLADSKEELKKILETVREWEAKAQFSLSQVTWSFFYEFAAQFFSLNGKPLEDLWLDPYSEEHQRLWDDAEKGVPALLKKNAGFDPVYRSKSITSQARAIEAYLAGLQLRRSEARAAAQPDSAEIRKFLGSIKAVGYDTVFFLHPSLKERMEELEISLPQVPPVILAAGYAVAPIEMEQEEDDLAVNAMIQAGLVYAGRIGEEGLFIKRATPPVVILGEKHGSMEGHLALIDELKKGSFTHVVLELKAGEQEGARRYVRGEASLEEALPDISPAARMDFEFIFDALKSELKKGRQFQIVALDPDNPSSREDRDAVVAERIQKLLEEPGTSILVLRGILHLESLLKKLNPDFGPLQKLLRSETRSMAQIREWAKNLEEIMGREGAETGKAADYRKVFEDILKIFNEAQRHMISRNIAVLHPANRYSDKEALEQGGRSAEDLLSVLAFFVIANLPEMSGAFQPAETGNSLLEDLVVSFNRQQAKARFEGKLARPLSLPLLFVKVVSAFYEEMAVPEYMDYSERLADLPGKTGFWASALGLLFSGFHLSTYDSITDPADLLSIEKPFEKMFEIAQSEEEERFTPEERQIAKFSVIAFLDGASWPLFRMAQDYVEEKIKETLLEIAKRPPDLEQKQRTLEAYWWILAFREKMAGRKELLLKWTEEIRSSPNAEILKVKWDFFNYFDETILPYLYEWYPQTAGPRDFDPPVHRLLLDGSLGFWKALIQKWSEPEEEGNFQGDTVRAEGGFMPFTLRAETPDEILNQFKAAVSQLGTQPAVRSEARSAGLDLAAIKNKVEALTEKRKSLLASAPEDTENAWKLQMQILRMLSTLEIPVMGIGDVHANADGVRAILSQVKPEQAVVQLGDWIDRGPDVVQTDALLRSFQADSKGHAFRLLGNHELMLLLGFLGDDEQLFNWIRNLSTEEKEKIPESILESYDADEYRKYLYDENQPYYALIKNMLRDIQNGNLAAAVSLQGKIFTHAGITPELMTLIEMQVLRAEEIAPYSIDPKEIPSKVSNEQIVEYINVIFRKSFTEAMAASEQKKPVQAMFQHPLFTTEGIFWTRGTLASWRHQVVGHTPQKGGGFGIKEKGAIAYIDTNIQKGQLSYLDIQQQGEAQGIFAPFDTPKSNPVISQRPAPLRSLSPEELEQGWIEKLQSVPFVFPGDFARVQALMPYQAKSPKSFQKVQKQIEGEISSRGKELFSEEEIKILAYLMTIPIIEKTIPPAVYDEGASFYGGEDTFFERATWVHGYGPMVYKQDRDKSDVLAEVLAEYYESARSEVRAFARPADAKPGTSETRRAEARASAQPAVLAEVASPLAAGFAPASIRSKLNVEINEDAIVGALMEPKLEMDEIHAALERQVEAWLNAIEKESRQAGQPPLLGMPVVRMLMDHLLKVLKSDANANKKIDLSVLLSMNTDKAKSTELANILPQFTDQLGRVIVVTEGGKSAGHDFLVLLRTNKLLFTVLTQLGLSKLNEATLTAQAVLPVLGEGNPLAGFKGYDRFFFGVGVEGISDPLLNAAESVLQVVTAVLVASRVKNPKDLKDPEKMKLIHAALLKEMFQELLAGYDPGVMNFKEGNFMVDRGLLRQFLFQLQTQAQAAKKTESAA